MRPSSQPFWCSVRKTTVLALLAFVLIFAGVTHYSETARAQMPHIPANVVAWQTLKAAQHVPTKYQGRPQTVAALNAGSVMPLAAASADFDSDGIADLVVGYASGNGGVLALHRGNLDAFAPQSHASWLATAQEKFPVPFLSQAVAIDLPDPPQFIVTGDFSGSGHVDILAGGSQHLYLLAGIGKGKFSSPKAIPLPGQLTALAAGKVGLRDGKVDLVVGIRQTNSAAVLVYKGSAGGLTRGAPVSYPLPQPATQLEIADLHGDGFSDIAALSGSEVLIIHPTGQAGADTTGLIERVPTSGSARSIAVGGFVWDRYSRNQLAVLSQNGNVQVLSSGELDTRPYNAQERFVRRSAKLRTKLPSGLKAPWSGQSEPWTAIKTASVSAPMAGNVRLMATSLAHSRPLDLMVVDSSDSRLHILPAHTTGDSSSDSQELTVETGDKPVAVLPMRVNVDGRPGLVMIGKSVSHPKVMAPLPDPTFVVNRFDDPTALVADAANYCNGGSNDCSLRQAIIKANSVSGSDNISLPAGTYNLTITGQGESASETGSLDVLDTVTITGETDGSGNPTSIIQGCGGSVACTGSDGATAWNDNFITTNKLGTSNASLTISNVIFQNGNNTNLASTNFGFDALGGAVLFYGCASIGGGCFDTNSNPLPASTLTITNVNFLNNSVGNGTDTGCSKSNNIDCGGALISQFGDTTISSSTFSSNKSTNGRGGAIVFSGAAETMTLSNSTVSGNNSGEEGGGLYVDFQNSNATGDIELHGNTFSSNSAGSDGGGIFVNLATGGNTSTATIDQLTTINGNSSAARGGGVVFWGISASPGTTSLTVNSTTITSNQAKGSTDGGGGIFVLAGGSVGLQYSRIFGNTTSAAGAPTGLSIESGTGGSASDVTASENWWGCNTGPSASPCDTAAIVNGTGATLTKSPWIVLTLTANPTSVQAIAPNNTSALTADFLHDSSSAAISASNIGVLIGLPISFGATAGTISGAQTTIQSDGTATATFTHDANCNASSANATVDTNPSPTVTTDITTLCPDLSATKINSTDGGTTWNSVGVTGMIPLSNPQGWFWRVAVANSGASNSAAATFANGQTILSDNLPSSNVSYGTAQPVAAGAFTGVTNSGNVSCGITSSVLTCVANGADVTIGVGGSFQVTFSAAPTSGGSYVNPTGGVCKVNPNNLVLESDASNDTNNNCSNTVIVVAPPTISKAFGATHIPVNGTTSLTFTLTNPSANTVSETGVAFTDTLTGGLQVAAAPNLTSTCGGTFTGATSGSTSLSLSGGTIGTGSSCTISLNVTGTTSGMVSNATGAISSTNGGTGTTSNTATLIVASPPTISKAFSASSIPLNGTTTLTFTINNPNSGIGLTGIGFSDSFPAGLQVASPPNASNTCGGTFTATAGGAQASLTGGSIAASGSCSASVTVTGTTTGTENNTTGAVNSTEGGTGTASNTASLTVVAPPSIAKLFGAASIPLNGSTSLGFTITNPNPAASLTGISFTDTLPSGLVVSTPNGATSSCGGTTTATAGGGSVSLVGGTTAAASSCSITVNVTGTTAGGKNNTTSAVSSTEGGTGNTASASINVVTPPSITKAFGAATIALNATTSLTFTITNPAPNTVAEAGVAFTDTLPTGLSVSSSTSTVCGGTLTTTNPTGISLTGAAIAVAGQCQFAVTVTGNVSGQFTNTTGAISSTNGGTGNTATASLIVASPPSIAKAFGATSIPLNGTTSLTLTITNSNSGLGLTGLSFTDTLPSGLVVAATPNLNNTCNGTPTAVGGVGSVSLSGGTVASSGSCTVSLSVQGTSAGVKNNSVQVTSGNAGPGNTANASITVVAPPTISKVFGATSIPLNVPTSVTFTISNPNATTALNGIAFTDTLPSGLVVATPNGATSSCGGTTTATAGGGSISLVGGTTAAASSCSITVNVTGTTAGVKNNTTSAVSSTEGGTGTISNTASLTVIAPPSIAKAFGAGTVDIGGTTTLTLTITNPNGGTALSGVAVTDNFPSGLQVASTSGLSNTCGGTATATAGGSSLSLSGGSIAAASNCKVIVNVTPTTSGTHLNTTGAVSSANGGTGNTASATLQGGDFTLSVSPTSQTVPAGHMAMFNLTLSSTTGFTGTINLGCSGGPSKSTCKVSPSSVTLTSGSTSGAVTIDWSVPNGAALGTYTITFTATSGSDTHTKTAQLTVK